MGLIVVNTREASGAESPGADCCVLVSMLVLSLSEQSACSSHRLSFQELGDDRQCVWLRPLNHQSWSLDDTDPLQLL